MRMEMPGRSGLRSLRARASVTGDDDDDDYYYIDGDDDDDNDDIDDDEDDDDIDGYGEN